MQRPVGRRWLTAMINVVEMEITDWRKKLSDQGRQHRGWSFVIYKAQYSINICWMASSSLRITNEKEIYYLEISLRGISKHFTPLPHAKTFKVGGELSGGAFLSRTTVFWGPPTHTHGQEIGLAQSLPIWEENGITARIILNSDTCQSMLNVKRTMAWT